MKMILKATRNASQRTKNRLRDHGPVFEDVTRLNTDRNLRHDDKLGWCVLVRGMKVTRRGWDQPWLGWLPIDEIERTSMGGVKFCWPLNEDLEPSSAGWVCLNTQEWQKECE